MGDLRTEKLLSVSEPWLQFSIRHNLLNEDKKMLSELKSEALRDKRIRAYLKGVSDFHGILVSNHKAPDLPINQLLFLLDNGFNTEITEIENAVKQIMSHKDKFGVYKSKTNIPKHYGGKGEDVFGWCLCDAPLLLRALLLAKIDYREHVKRGVDHLTTLINEQGFPCSVSEEHGSFRGPGRKGDCCPFATLSMLNLYAEIDEYRKSDVAKRGIDAILSLWENSLERHPYMFYTGTDFRKLKAPAMWYDIVSVTDCLSKFECARKDTRFCEMIEIIKSKQDPDGLFIPESVYQKCKDWDFGQKKTVSPYLSFLCIRLLSRLE
ncbi:MAG: hypothetical protein FWC52_04180 [Candidatus Methanoplasma sp.]|nr:hypothetical protein [Candidatus Methanoplasma sp.]